MVRRRGNETAEQVPLQLRVHRLGPHLHRLFLRKCQQIFPQSLHRLFQLTAGEPSQIPVGVHPKPHQKSFLRQKIAQRSAQGFQRFPEVLEVGRKCAAFLLRPFLSRLFSQKCQKLSIVTGVAKLDLIQVRYLIKL